MPALRGEMGMWRKVASRLMRGREMLQMQLGHHRARRYSFHAGVELTDLQSETQTKEQTSDLSLFGCHVATPKPLPPGTKVRVKISHRSESLEALGRVAFVRPHAGMGIFFTIIALHDQLLLAKCTAYPTHQSNAPSV